MKHFMQFKIYGWIILISLSWGWPTLQAQTLRFSGVLGQSQPADSQPLPMLGSVGVVCDTQGQLWTSGSYSRQLIALNSNNDGKWTIRHSVKLPMTILPQAGLVSDGQAIFYIGYEGKHIYRFDPQTLQVRVFGNIPTAWEKLSSREKTKLVLSVAPLDLNQGYATRAKVFLMFANQVHGINAQGKDMGMLVDLPRPVKAPKQNYVCLAIQPRTGDILCGTGWPDSTVYRFDPSGQQVTKGNWPRERVNPKCLQLLGDEVWAVTGLGGAHQLPQTLHSTHDAITIKPHWTNQATGLAMDKQGQYWMSCHQGLVAFDPQGQPAESRMGGLPDVNTLAVGSDGMVYAAMGGQISRLMIDDDSNTLLRNDSREPFRVGYSWNKSAVDMAWAGQNLLVLEKKFGQLWRFVPEPVRLQWPFKPRPWEAVTVADTFKNPKSLALAEGRWWVLDGQSIQTGLLRSPQAMQAITLPGLQGTIQKLAALDKRTLVVATQTQISAWQDATGKGHYQRIWLCPQSFMKISDVAAKGDLIAVTDNKQQCVVLLNADGQQTAQLQSDAIPHSMSPEALAIRGRWLIVADQLNHRLLRLKTE